MVCFCVSSPENKKELEVEEAHPFSNQEASSKQVWKEEVPGMQQTANKKHCGGEEANVVGRLCQIHPNLNKTFLPRSGKVGVYEDWDKEFPSSAS